HARVGEQLEAGPAAAPDFGRPGETGAAVHADDVLPATRTITIARDAERRGTLKTRTEQELCGAGRNGCDTGRWNGRDTGFLRPSIQHQRKNDTRQGNRRKTK